MTRIIPAAFSAAMALTVIGCSGEKPAPQAKANSTNTNKIETAPAANVSGNSAIPAASSAADANVARENPMTAKRNRRLEEMRRKGADPSAPKPDLEATLRNSTRPAPEDSEFSVALTDKLFERRTFRRHPLLAKVEKVTAGPEKKITVFTRDGRAIELPGDSIESLSTAKAAAILSAAGVGQQRRAVSDTKAEPPEKN